MDAKQAAGEAAAGFVEDGMSLGLGTGSTVSWTLLALGERVRHGLTVRGVPTSEGTERLARELGIPLISLGEVPELDLAIDGADEVSWRLDLIKGGGGALLREKLVALAARRRVIVAEEAKLVERLGARPLPVEVVPFGWETTARRIAAIGGDPRLRRQDGQPLVTDGGHYILDCSFGLIRRPAELERRLKSLTGVVESGLFVGVADIVLLGRADGVSVMRREQSVRG